MAKTITQIDLSGIDKLQRAAPDDASRWLDMVATDIVSDIKLSFGTSPPGKKYVRDNGVVHVASQAGYPPNVDTGALRASMRWEAAGKLRRMVMDGVEYGYKLEVGTSEVAPRPFVSPVFIAWRQKIYDAADDLDLTRSLP